MPRLIVGRRMTTEQQALVESCWKLARKLARKWHDRTGLDFDECLSTANMALCRSVFTFKPDLGYAFATHAGNTIAWGLSDMIHPSRRTQRRPPDAMTGIDFHEWTAARVDQTADDVEQLHKLLSVIPAKWRKILLLRNAGWKLHEIGQMYGTSKTRIEQIEKQALRTIRQHIGRSACRKVHTGAAA